MIIESIEDQNQKLMGEIESIKNMNELQANEYESRVSRLIKDKEDMLDINAA